MKNILVPIGTSKNGKNTLQYAIDLANVLGANVYALNAFQVPSSAGTLLKVDDIYARERTNQLKDLVSELDTNDVTVNIIAAKGEVLDAVQSVNNELGIDLIVVGPRPNDIDETLFLGKTTGKLIKQTNLPVLVVPEDYAFSPINTVLMAIKSGIISNETSLYPLKSVLSASEAAMHLLQVRTKEFLPEDAEFFSDLADLISSYNSSENPTLFEGLKEHLEVKTPDLICVFRRKRGFFKRLFEQNTIKKSAFNSTLPLLVLKGAE